MVFDNDYTIDWDSRIDTKFGPAFLNRSGRYVVRFNRVTYVSLHRLVYEDEIGDIPRNWEVHHKDFNRLNNKASNLEAMPRDRHKILHEEARREKLRAKKERKKAHRRARKKQGGEYNE